MAIYFISDLHFGSAWILKERSAFRTAEEMDRVLTERWNAKVNNDDTVYILGDIGGSYTANAVDCIQSLHGRKYLILGNHDQEWMRQYPSQQVSALFEGISWYEEITVGDALLSLCHYPGLEWRGSRKNPHSYMIHGHIHTRRDTPTYAFIRKNLPNMLNCCPEINGYEPVTFEELIRNNFVWYGKTGYAKP